MAMHPPATRVSRWARSLPGAIPRRRRKGVDGAGPSDAQWARPDEPDDTFRYERTPEPWPPPPPTPPARPEPEESGGDDESAAASAPRLRHRRAVAVGAAVAVLSAWVGVAAFMAPRSTQTTQSEASSTTTNQTSNNGFYRGGGGFSRRGTSGVIQAIAGPTITLLDRNGQSVTVRTSSSTEFTKTVMVSVHRVRPGDTIVASGVYSQANATLAAGRIAIVGAAGSTPGGGRSFPTAQANVALGTVTAIEGDHLTVNQFDGTTVAVVISPSVTVTAPVTGSLGDMAPGEPITVRGPGDDRGAVDASLIEEGNGAGFLGPRSFDPSAVNDTGSFGLNPASVIQS